MSKTILAVVGPIAAGKGTIIGILKKMGFESSSTSDRIREEIKKRGLVITRDSLTEVSNNLRSKFGDDILSRRTAEYLERAKSDFFVIDSIRNPQEIQFFKTKYNMKIIAITASQKVRYKRFTERKTNSEPMTFERFCEIDDKELNGSQGAHSQRVVDCMKMADVTVDNSGSVDELIEQIKFALQKLGVSTN